MFIAVTFILENSWGKPKHSIYSCGICTIYIYIYIYTHTHTHTHISCVYIYIYIYIYDVKVHDIYVLLRNLYAGQKATVRTRHGTTWTGFKLGKEYVKAVYCHPVCLTSMQSISCDMPGWMKQKLESRLLAETSITSDNADNTTLMAESK